MCTIWYITVCRFFFNPMCFLSREGTFPSWMCCLLLPSWHLEYRSLNFIHSVLPCASIVSMSAEVQSDPRTWLKCKNQVKSAHLQKIWTLLNFCYFIWACLYHSVIGCLPSDVYHELTTWNAFAQHIKVVEPKTSGHWGKIRTIEKLSMCKLWCSNLCFLVS